MAASVTCLCGAVALTVELDPAEDPTQLQLCHCHDCRVVTGLLFSSYYLLQHEPPALETLQKYQESPHVSRFFCRTCGAHVFAQTQPNGRFLVASGILIDKDTPPVRSIQHWKVSDTIDGGLAVFLPEWPSKDTSCRLQTSPHRSVINPAPQDLEQNRNIVHAGCHCGGVQFDITPPDASSAQAFSQWCDVLVPFNGDFPDKDNHADVKWWLREGHTKFFAATCACVSCRLGSGFPIQVWAFIPKSNLFNRDRSPLTFGSGTMKVYNSSPGVYREFCARCGATIFWHNDGRPTLIDVSVGLIRGPGARALALLDWGLDRVSFAETAVQIDLVDWLETGMRQFSGRQTSRDT
ncbi:hypothetical protein N7462_006253 [Penicillium macrosclerotiorum]|uniref:uncharacterized protein n=1 Tax=Penicillium macrosclerotiorum TaxID=303699 RepID=UPI0025471462|nr:uncharacterized protein N7462_006253 [Penicillium macrosclerotiorum]KAJ5683088.1 hypothetical protein N7462_006253 [Penicillium macrosclerotiorum]